MQKGSQTFKQANSMQLTVHYMEHRYYDFFLLYVPFAMSEQKRSSHSKGEKYSINECVAVSLKKRTVIAEQQRDTLESGVLISWHRKHTLS